MRHPSSASLSGPLLLLILASLTLVSAQTNCQGKPNYQPIFTSDPVFVSSSTNGKLYMMKDVDPPLWVIHVYGSPYDMGFAQGTLLKTQIANLTVGFYDYVYAEMEPYLKWLPPQLRQVIEELGAAAALDLTFDLTKPYIADYFLQEIQGMADGSGVPYQQLLQIQMFPELIKAACSMYGAWDQATANATSPGRLFQLRALDWGTNGPFQQYPVVTIYHPDSGNGHAFANVAWTGFIGSLTGYSSAPVGICEKVWLGYNGTSSRRGIPWNFLLRDILQFDADINAAVSRMADAHRTCSIFVGVGDQTNRFVAVGYSYETVDVWDNIDSPTWSGHPKLPDLVYIDKHVQPSSDPCMGSLMQKYYGKLDAETAIRQVAPVFQTGDMHVAVYDYAQNFVYVSNASPYNNATGIAIPAYDRAYVRLNMTALFAEPHP